VFWWLRRDQLVQSRLSAWSAALIGLGAMRLGSSRSSAGSVFASAAPTGDALETARAIGQHPGSARVFVFCAEMSYGRLNDVTASTPSGRHCGRRRAPIWEELAQARLADG